MKAKRKLVEILLGEELNTYLVSHGWTHPLLSKIEVIKEDNISSLSSGRSTFATWAIDKSIPWMSLEFKYYDSY